MLIVETWKLWFLSDKKVLRWSGCGTFEKFLSARWKDRLRNKPLQNFSSFLFFQFLGLCFEIRSKWTYFWRTSLKILSGFWEPRFELSWKNRTSFFSSYFSKLIGSEGQQLPAPKVSRVISGNEPSRNQCLTNCRAMEAAQRGLSRCQLLKLTGFLGSQRSTCLARRAGLFWNNTTFHHLKLVALIRSTNGGADSDI